MQSLKFSGRDVQKNNEYSYVTFCSITRPAEPNTRQMEPARLQNPAGPARINFPFRSQQHRHPTLSPADRGPGCLWPTCHRHGTSPLIPHPYLYRTGLKTLASVVASRSLPALPVPSCDAWVRKEIRIPERNGQGLPLDCCYLVWWWWCFCYCVCLSSNGEEAVALSGSAAEAIACGAASRLRRSCGGPRACVALPRSMRLWCGP